MENTTSRNNFTIEDTESTSEVIVILQSLIASVGITANLTVVIVFLNSKKLRGKIPNIFIINQVYLLVDYFISFIDLNV